MPSAARWWQDLSHAAQPLQEAWGSRFPPWVSLQAGMYQRCYHYHLTQPELKGNTCCHHFQSLQRL